MKELRETRTWRWP